ncbi:MAG: hypothetical protein COS82_01685 [Zetaproteobacteria bacterium CG06_land_8_20_14_3_00_59_53]|nr:MAG: hypothetical protein COX56_03370 [Zetaproteobacteria bacterium CG23_combo_of_CG06-09_8_20_14_all_59_86]PIU71254.1 MAG: hypothetical protein COS82_01685 [Zetaproteobacteria bacterium CG06_land_8_20_14_3_00_59_53]PIY45955.1 MAG: hypothetical protein COZ02_07075 [Zetaproteobacteria bacterium CG_4_10_14_0_8_um_filter_59_127]PJC18976.1 MAG: hypothetical protein CO062_01535 [Zetaproteobacteria bacterium CG_4_9_14_0_2_um_filter_59_191]
MMIDHAPRIRAEQQAEQENAIMADLEQRSAPLYWALVAAVVALVLAGIADQASGFAQHYADLQATNEAFAQCLNGRAIGIDSGDGGIVRCNVRQYPKLVAGIQP